MGKKKKVVSKKTGAKKGAGENKARAIREYCASHPKDGPNAVAAALNKQKGWSISPQYVSTIKSNAKKSGGKKTRASSATKPRNGAETFTVSSLLTAKKLAEELGGVSQAKAALDAVSKLVN